MTTTLDALTSGVSVGAVLPLLTAVVQRPAWSAKWKKVVAVAVAVVGGVGTVAAHGGLAQLQHGHVTVATLLGVLAASQTTYDLVWKPSNLAPMIEALTTPKTSQ